MATYGRGQMLGSGINPESFKQDYSGFANAAAIRAQGISNLGASIGGVIKEFGEIKKEQKKVDALNKASAKAIEAAITLGNSYDIGGVEETLSPFLKSYNDPNLSPIEKAALLEEGKAMIPNVFGRFDQSQAMAIQKAQIDLKNKPPLPDILKFTPKLLKTAKGDLSVVESNDGSGYYYDPVTKLPIFDLNAYGEGLPVENWTIPNQTDVSLMPGETVIPLMPGETVDPYTGLSPNLIDEATALSDSATRKSSPNLYYQEKGPLLASGIDSAQSLGEGSVLPPKDGSQSDLPAVYAANEDLMVNKQSPQLQKGKLAPRYIGGEGKKEEPKGTIMTLEEVEQLTAKGVKINAVPQGQGKFLVTESTFGDKPLVELNTGQTDQQERFKKMDEMLFETKKQLEGASQNKDSIKKMVDLLDEGVKTGFGRETIMKFNRIFGKDVSDAETFRSVSGDVAMGFINLTKGAISDREMAYFTTVLAPNLGNTPEGNRKIGNFMLGAIKKAEKIEKTISEGLSQGKNAFDIDKEVMAIRNADDLLVQSPENESNPAKPLTAEDELDKILKGEEIK